MLAWKSAWYSGTFTHCMLIKSRYTVMNQLTHFHFFVTEAVKRHFKAIFIRYNIKIYINYLVSQNVNYTYINIYSEKGQSQNYDTLPHPPE